MVRPRVVGVLSRVLSVGRVLTVVDPLVVVLAGLLTLPGVEAVPVGFAALATLMVCRGAGLHRPRLVLSVLEDLAPVLLASITAVLALVVVSPVVDLEVPRDAGMIAMFGGLCFAGLVLGRVVAHALARLLRRSRRVARPVLIVGAGAIGRRLADALLTRHEFGLRPVGMLDCGPRLSLRGLPLPLVGGISDLDQAMIDLGVDHVIFAFPEPPDQDTLSAVRRCVERDRQVFVVPRFFELMGKDRHRQTELIRDISVMRLQRWGIGVRHRLLTRMVDVVVSAGSLVVLAPLLALIAIAVRIETGPGVIFQQTRVGEGGRPFTLLKFTTLRPAQFGADTTVWNIDNASRIGRVGRLLRRTGLDELPQLVNVLRGEMSLVGPRPGLPRFVAEFAREPAPTGSSVAASEGLTGWAQLDQHRSSPRRDEPTRLSAPGGSLPAAGTRETDPELTEPRRG